MTEPRHCPQCGDELPPDAPAGLCPRCLLKQGRDSPSGAEVGQSDLPPTTPPSGSFVPPEPEGLAPLFANLEILELLGKGGMGAVYKARQPHLDRFVALKILPPEVGEDPAFQERFTREAQALAKLSHPHIVAVYDFGQAGDFFYFLMEYVDGTNIRQLIQQGGLKAEQVLAIVPQICEALQYAHDEGIIHRDIKPENILVDKKGRVKIADFGLAKLVGKAPHGVTLTGTAQVMGTLHYMAPEQMKGSHAVDHRADIYSLGVVFYEMLTGELPIGKFELPSKKVQIDVRLDEVVLRALENEPERRYQAASEVKTDVERISSSAQIAAPVTPTRLSPATMPMMLACASAILLGMLSMMAGVALAVYALLTQDTNSGAFWGWMGGALGCFIGGGGTLLGGWNSYRQLEGAGDLMNSLERTWLDWLMMVYTLLGVASITGGIAAHYLCRAWVVSYSLVLLGGMMVFQGVLFLYWRALARRSATRATATGQQRARREIPWHIVAALLIWIVAISIAVAVGLLNVQPQGHSSPMVTVRKVPLSDAERPTPGLSVFRYELHVPPRYYADFSSELWREGKLQPCGIDIGNGIAGMSGPFELRLLNGETISPLSADKLRWKCSDKTDTAAGIGWGPDSFDPRRMRTV